MAKLRCSLCGRDKGPLFQCPGCGRIYCIQCMRGFRGGGFFNPFWICPACGERIRPEHRVK